MVNVIITFRYNTTKNTREIISKSLSDCYETITLADHSLIASVFGT